MMVLYRSHERYRHLALGLCFKTDHNSVNNLDTRPTKEYINKKIKTIVRIWQDDVQTFHILPYSENGHTLGDHVI